VNLSKVGHYRVEERIGAGGMGQVYRAYDERLDRWVAIKIIAPDLRKDEVHRERLRREARASARLTHPAIVKIFDLLLTDEADAIVMELVEGVSLAQILHDGPLDLPRAFSVGREIADALTEAHSHGIVHRDLKTENVVFTPAGHPKILDFGIAKLLEQTGASLTLDGRVLGTCRAMAPEQAEGREIDHRADLFALGNLLYEVLTGQSPFLDRNAASTLHRVCTHRQPPVRALDPWIPAELSNLIDQLLEKEPALRPRSAREVAVRLARIAAEVQLSYAGEAGSETEGGVATLVELPASPLPAHPNPAQPLPAHAASPPPALRFPPPALSAVERRQVTVLLCGPVHPGGEPLDPEEMLDGMRELHNAMAEIVERFEGHLGPARDFGWLAYFGYPRAREDDACQAVRAALHVVEQARALCPTTGCDLARLRAGIHTGPMILAREPFLGGDARNQNQPLGETPSVAALIQSLAGPGAVLVSQATHRLIEGFFDCADLGLSLPIGSSRPAPVYRIEADRGLHSRFAAAGRLTPLVGREQELGLLLEHWEHAREGRGQLMLLGGEAGIGKSRLVWELRHRIDAGSVEWLEGYAAPDQRHSPLHPFLPILHQLLGTGGEGTRGERLRRLEEELTRQALTDADRAPLLAELLGLSDTEPPTVSTVSPAAQRRRVLECVVSLLLAAAERRPLLIAIEDLHCADLPTLELLDLLIQHLAGSPVFLLLTTRPEPQPQPSISFGTHLTLAPLTRSQAHRLVDTLTEGREIDPPRTEQIVARADGVPLFIEELTRMELETGPSPEIPAPLEGWLRARLDRLGPARELVQVASAIGRELSWTLLREVSHWDDATLKAGLDRLVDAEILHRRGLHPASRFRFRHALLQDAAYSSLLRSDRQKLHRQIARVLERSPESAESPPEMVAHHFTEAGQPEEAVIWWQRAGERASGASAWREALGHFERAVTALLALPERPERDFLEVGLQAQLGEATAAVRSDSTPEAGTAYARAWELCQRLSGAPRQDDILRGLCRHSLIAGEEEAATLAAGRLLDFAHQQAHQQARQQGDPSLLITGHQAMGFARLLGGDLTQACAHLEEALDGSESPADPAKLAALANLSWVLWLLGHPDQALRRAREASELARTLAVPSLSTAFVEFSIAELHAFRREPEEVRRHAEVFLPLATGQGFQLFAALGQFLLGWSRDAQGDGDEAMAAMRASLAARRALRAHAFLPSHKALLADAYLRADRIVEGLATLKEALALQGDQRILEAELHRLKGELLRRHGKPDAEVEAHLQRSLEVARRQGARSLELRAALSHASLRAHQGRKSEGHDLLASVYETFTEGFETPDLREARAMLEEME
jgi:class 3 adenylate cyclase/predicted ATPase/tRNA A-37 threonylcarbamoyl transferase component Bud32